MDYITVYLYSVLNFTTVNHDSYSRMKVGIIYEKN